MAITGDSAVLRWDMMRARHNGRIVYRHLPGLLRIVRGRMSLKMTHVPVLGRSSFTATFLCATPGRDDPLPLHDAHLVHADEMRLVLSGYECVEDLGREVHYGQTWVLVPCEGHAPEPSIGPAFAG
jgi:hypothetical protein